MSSELGPLPDPALIVLIGASASGKSTWATARYRADEVASSDAWRGVVGSGVHDLDATADAFTVLDLVVEARARRHLTVVVDTLGLDPHRRQGYLAVARRHGVPAVAVLFETPAALCRQRNRGRDRPVPAEALSAQLRRMAGVPAELATEGWTRVLRVTSESAAPPTPTPTPTNAQPVPAQSAGPAGTRFVLQISRFPWGDDPAGWLRGVAEAADHAGFHGVALMDHFIQIPQVGRAWEPIPEPWVTLGLLAGFPSRLQLGTLVSPITLHQAGRLAKTVATLDALSGGRAFCGVGAGWWAREHAGYGLPFPPAGQRLADLEAGIEIMRALWAPGTKPYRSARVELAETTCYPRPVGDVRIVVGGSGPRMLEIADRLGDAGNVPSDLASVRRARAAMTRAELTVLDVPVVGRDRAEVAALVERLRGRTPASQFAARHHAGLVGDHVARYRELAGEGVSTVFVALPNLAGPAEVAAFAPIISACADAPTAAPAIRL